MATAQKAQHDDGRDVALGLGRLSRVLFQQEENFLSTWYSFDSCVFDILMVLPATAYHPQSLTSFKLPDTGDDSADGSEGRSEGPAYLRTLPE